METGTILTGVIRHLHAQADDAAADADLLARYAHRRDEAAFAAVVRRYGGLVLGVAGRQLPDRDAADDVFQATFLALARSAGRLGRRTPLANWLYTVALRQARKARVRAARRTEHESTHAPPAASPDPLAEISGRELLRVVDEELAALPERYRLPVLLCCVQGLSREEAAARLGWSDGRVKGRLERGRQQLAARLARRGLAPAGLVFAPAATVGVPADLLGRTTALAAAPWSDEVPAGVLALAADGAPRRLLPLAAAVGALAVAGAAALALSGGGRAPAPADPPPTPKVETAAAPADDPLPAGSVLRFGTSRFRHGLSVTCMAVSPDGKTAFVTNDNDTPRVFDLASGRVLFSLNWGSIEAGVYSPDGRTIVLKQGFDLYVFDAATGKELRKIARAGGNLRSASGALAITPDGKAIATVSDGKDVHLIDFETGETIRDFVHDIPESGSPRDFSQVLAIAFSADGKLMATGGYANEKGNYFARLWDVETGKELRRFMHGEKGYGIASLAFSPDGKTLATLGTQSGVFLRLFDVDTAKERKAFPKDGDQRTNHGSVAFSPDGKTVAAALGSIHLYDTTTGEERLRIDRRASDLHFTDGGKTLTAAVGGAIYRWDTSTGRLLTPEAADSVVEQILVTADGSRVVTLGQDAYGHIWDGASGQHLRRIPVAYYRGLAISPDGRFLAWPVDDYSVQFAEPRDPRSLYYGSRIRVYDIAAGKSEDRIPTFKGVAQDLAFTSDGKRLVTSEQHGGLVRIWNFESGKEERSFPILPDALKQQTFFIGRTQLSPDGKTVVVNYQQDTGGRLGMRSPPQALRLWDVASGKELPQLSAGQPIERAFSPDGRFVVTRGGNHVYEIATGRRVASLPDDASIQAVAFSRDGHCLATCSREGVTLWEVATWTRRTEFRGHRDRPTTLTFGPGGRLFSGSVDTTVLAWETRPPRPTAAAPIAAAWLDLTEADAAPAFQAQGRLLADPAASVELFAGKVKPVERPDAARLAKLVADLGSSQFAIREAATKALRALGGSASAALREAAEQSESAEVRRRTGEVLAEIEAAAPSPDDLRAVRSVEVLEWANTAEARRLLATWAAGAPGARLTAAAEGALKRMSR